MTLYNDCDPVCADWLRWLMAQGLIGAGQIDQRPIQEIEPHDTQNHTRVHLFAGIGGWERAAQLAGWPDDRPLWTASCPCQPFSVAGKGLGRHDPRHLWPHVFRLVRACRPPVVVGEQVAGKAGYDWIDGVFSDLESAGYACRAVDIPACAVDAPQIRQRFYWVAMRDVDDALRARPQGWRVNDNPIWADEADKTAAAPDGRDRAGCQSFWSDAEWIACHDGKTRRTKPGVRLLAHGVPSRMAKWSGMGNAIAPPLAAEVLRALL